MATRRRQLRWWLKWAGLVACVTIAGLWGMAARWQVYVDAGRWEFAMVAGRIGCSHVMFDVGSGTRSILGYEPETWKDRFGLSWPESGPWSSGTHYWSLEVPLWWLFLIAGIPSAYAWYRDRQSWAPGHCSKCGYNLTGNVSGRCPECGNAI